MKLLMHLLLVSSITCTFVDDSISNVVFFVVSTIQKLSSFVISFEISLNYNILLTLHC